MKEARIDLVRECNGVPIATIKCQVKLDDAGEWQLDAAEPITDHERTLVLDATVHQWR